MLKLITVNIEMSKHDNRVLALLDREQPDVVCLQEAPEAFSQKLQERGYQTTFAPMFIRDVHGEKAPVGVMLASNLPHDCRTHYYHQGASSIVEHDANNTEKTASFAYLISTINAPEGTFTIATTHVMDTDDGHKDDFQILGITNLLNALKQEASHIICGDFNIPRGYNTLYNDVTQSYIDEIPQTYKSSLDRNLHRLGNKKIVQPIFDEYMVDYIFSQPPYRASDVRLEFDISDHAAVIAHISKTRTE